MWPTLDFRSLDVDSMTKYDSTGDNNCTNISEPKNGADGWVYCKDECESEVNHCCFFDSFTGFEPNSYCADDLGLFTSECNKYLEKVLTDRDE